MFPLYAAGYGELSCQRSEKKRDINLGAEQMSRDDSVVNWKSIHYSSALPVYAIIIVGSCRYMFVWGIHLQIDLLSTRF